MVLTCSLVWSLSLLVSLFFLWGAANALNDILIKQFSKAFSLKAWEAGLVQSAFYVGYFFGGLPAAKVAREHGFKTAVVVGLALYALGAALFFPFSRDGGSYLAFLVCLYLIAFGLAFLESSANPWVKVLGDEYRKGSGTIALNVAQVFNPAGLIAGVACGQLLILDNRQPPGDAGELAVFQFREARLVGPPYLAISFVVALVAMAFVLTRFPELSGKSSAKRHELSAGGIMVSVLNVLHQPGLLHGVVAQFFYVAGQVSVWSFVIQYVQCNIPDIEDQSAANFLTASLVLFIIGRFLCSAALFCVPDTTLLTGCGCTAAACCALAATAGGWTGVGAVCSTSLFMSTMYPTIFGLAIAGLPEGDCEVGASTVVMAIVGGACAPPLMGALSDATSMTTAYMVPAVCFLIVASYGTAAGRRRAQAAETRTETQTAGSKDSAADENVVHAVGFDDPGHCGPSGFAPIESPVGVGVGVGRPTVEPQRLGGDLEELATLIGVRF